MHKGLDRRSQRLRATVATLTPGGQRRYPPGLRSEIADYARARMRAGDVFLFVGRTRRRAKVLWYDGTGLCLLGKRLDQGRFASPWVQGKNELELTMSELALLLEGCEVVGRIPLSPPAVDAAKAGRVLRASFC
jgi:transposase